MCFPGRTIKIKSGFEVVWLFVNFRRRKGSRQTRSISVGDLSVAVLWNQRSVPDQEFQGMKIPVEEAEWKFSCVLWTSTSFLFLKQL